MSTLIESQKEPCPTCGQTAGWWSRLTCKSMIFHEPNGDVEEQRIYEQKAKYCAACDTEITPHVNSKPNRI